MKGNVKIIAEAGCNHNGNFDDAVNLISIAKDCGADSVKFQIIFPEGLYAPYDLVDGKKIDNPVIKERNKTILPDQAYIELSKIAKDLDIDFSASIFCRRGLELLLRCDPAFIKLASVDLNNHILIQQAAETKLPLILSTGFSTEKDIKETIDFLDSIDCQDYSILHCVSVYPAPEEIMNLPFIKSLQKFTNKPIGLSDHSDSPVCALVSLSMGVSIIEKHYTYDRSLEGFDHAHSMNPEQFKNYIQTIRIGESSLMLQENKLSSGELEVRQRARRGLYYKRDLQEGHTISLDDIDIVRPTNSLNPSDSFNLIGSRVLRDVCKGDDICLEDFEK